MQFYKNFIGYPEGCHIEEFSGSDTEILFRESLAKKPDDWYYRTHPISYIRNSYGHRCKELDKLDLNNYILFVGCSYTEGIGVELEKSYPYLVSSDLGTDYYNLALGGTGVDVTTYNLIQWKNVVNVQPKAIVIQWPSTARYCEIDKNNSDVLCTIGPWEQRKAIATFLTVGELPAVSYFNNKKLVSQRLIRTLFTCPIIEFVMPDIAEQITEIADFGRDQHPGINSNRAMADIVKEKILNEIR